MEYTIFNSSWLIFIVSDTKLVANWSHRARQNNKLQMLFKTAVTSPNLGVLIENHRFPNTCRVSVLILRDSVLS